MLPLEIDIRITTVNIDLDADIDKLEKEIAFRIPEEARKLMDDSIPAGRLYRRKAITARATKGGLSMGLKRRGKSRMVTGFEFHRASARGQAPAEDTGKLYREITVRRMSKGNYRVRFGAGYAGYLEFELDRPFIRPAIEIAVQKAFSQSKLFL